MTTLRRRMMEDMQVRSLSPRTQATYVQQVSLFARHFNRSPELLGPEEIRQKWVKIADAPSNRHAPGYHWNC
jgi:integrase/recombinase XerD